MTPAQWRMGVTGVVPSVGAPAVRASRGRATRRVMLEQMPRQTPASDAILRRVRETPTGFVRTYGDVSPGAPRHAGAVLHACDDPTVPWHRLVRADGSLAKGRRQRRLLEREGVPFRGDRVDLRVARIPG